MPAGAARASSRSRSKRKRVDPFGFEREPVPGRLRQEGVRPESLAQRVDGVLQRAEGGARRVGTPEILDQAVGGDDLAGMKSEHREKRALLAARQRYELLPDELERPEQPNLHPPFVAPRTTAE